MGQPDLSKSEARLLECLQEKQSLTGWPSAIANIARINTNGLNYARRNLSTVLSETSRRKLVSKIRQVCQ